MPAGRDLCCEPPGRPHMPTYRVFPLTVDTLGLKTAIDPPR